MGRVRYFGPPWLDTLLSSFTRKEITREPSQGRSGGFVNVSLLWCLADLTSTLLPNSLTS
eukprot:jgi/Botrbrau1/5466/Bobra.27_1s0017.1